jgi:hypothetical protein
MNHEIVRKLSYGLLLRASHDRLLFGTTKLIKLIYLVDCEYFRWNRRTLTEADWIFYHYGPYSAALIDAINAAPAISVQSEIELEDGRSFREYKLKSLGTDPILRLHFSVRGAVDSVYKRWAASDLSLLLDYVYYETPPMISAIRNQPLDFSLIPGPRNAEPPDIVRDFSTIIAAEKREALQRRLRESAARYHVCRKPVILEIDEQDQAAFLAMGDRD